MSITQNKLTPMLVVVAALIVGYVLYVKVTAKSAPVASGTPMAAAPQPGMDPASAPKAAGGLFGGSNLPPTRSGDADNNAETLSTVTASNRELRASVQRVIEENEALKRQNAAALNNEDAIAAKVKAQLQAEANAAKAATTTPASVSNSPVGGLIDNGLDAATKIINGVGSQPGAPGAARTQPAAPGQVGAGGSSIPAGLGYDGMTANAGQAPMPPAPGAALSRVIAPLGYRTASASEQGGERGATLVRTSLAAPPTAYAPGSAPTAPLPPSKPELEPYFTIPENATLGHSTSMTTLVGRVPMVGCKTRCSSSWWSAATTWRPPASTCPMTSPAS